MVERRDRPPWPDRCFVLELDALPGEVTADQLLALERRQQPVVGVVRGPCEGPALAAACAVQLLVAGPQATFRASGPSADLAVRRARDIVGRRVASYLTVRAISATDAHTWGLVSRLSEEPEQLAEQLCELLATRSSTAVSTILAQLGRHATADHLRSEVTSRALERPESQIPSR